MAQYFANGTRLAWVVNPKNRTIEVYCSPRHANVLREGAPLDGGSVLPGFSFPIAGIFEMPDFDA